MRRAERTCGEPGEGAGLERKKTKVARGKTGEYQEGDRDGGFTPEAVSVKTSIKTLPCACTESEYISVH